MKTLVITPFVTALALSTSLLASNQNKIGVGDINQPVDGPAPAYDYDEANIDDYVLVKNWDFGGKGTIGNIQEMSDEFQYHDQFGTIANGTKYGAFIVAPDRENALKGQPIEGENTDRKVREFTSDSLKTYLVGLDGAEEVHPKNNKAGNGSFQAKWTLPTGGSLLGKDLIWETRVRYETPPYFWFAIWTAGNKWNRGAEMDLIESFGWDNGGGRTNYDGDYWHSSVVAGKNGFAETNYHRDWIGAMKSYGITDFDASEYHVWTWVYRADDTFTAFVDGIPVQRGATPWTLGAKINGEPLDMSFIFDGSWGHREVSSVNHPLLVSELEGKFYEWDYSRVYLRDATDSKSIYRTDPITTLDLSDSDVQMALSPHQNAEVRVETDSEGKDCVRIVFEKGNYPGIVLEPAGGFDLSKYSEVDVLLTNTGSSRVGITARLDNEGDWQQKPYSASAVSLSPGETKNVTIEFGKTFGKAGHNLDPKAVKQFMLFANTPDAPGSILISSINAN